MVGMTREGEIAWAEGKAMAMFKVIGKLQKITTYCLVSGIICMIVGMGVLFIDLYYGSFIIALAAPLDITGLVYFQKVLWKGKEVKNFIKKYKLV